VTERMSKCVIVVVPVRVPVLEIAMLLAMDQQSESEMFTR